MLAISTRINSKLQKDDLPILQYYLRYHDDRCFDLLALVPKDVFFDYVDDAKQKILNQEIRQIGYKKDYRVALIVLPLIDNLQFRPDGSYAPFVPGSPATGAVGTPGAPEVRTDTVTRRRSR